MKTIILLKKISICVFLYSAISFVEFNRFIDNSLQIIDGVYIKKAKQEKQDVEIPKEVREIKMEILYLSGRNKGFNRLLLGMSSSLALYLICVYCITEKKKDGAIHC